jgi:hypothetical protein
MRSRITSTHHLYQPRQAPGRYTCLSDAFAQRVMARSMPTTLYGRLHDLGRLKSCNILRNRIEALLNRFGIHRNPKKGLWEPTQDDDHLGLTIDLLKGEFRAPTGNQHAFAKHALALFGCFAID